MDFAWYVVGYFAVGVALFMAFWRWFETGIDGENSFSVVVLMLWPVVIIGLLLLAGFDFLKKIAKIGVKK